MKSASGGLKDLQREGGAVPVSRAGMMMVCSPNVCLQEPSFQLPLATGGPTRGGKGVAFENHMSHKSAMDVTADLLVGLGVDAKKVRPTPIHCSPEGTYSGVDD